MPDSEELRRAVKDALDDKRMDDIAHQISDLSTQMTKGFAEVHTRQDTANGKLLKHDRILDAQKAQANYEKLLWFILTTLVGVVVYFITKG